MSESVPGKNKGGRYARHLPKRISFSREFLLETSLLTRQRFFRSQHDLRETLTRLDEQRRRSLDTYRSERRELNHQLLKWNEDKAQEAQEAEGPAPRPRRNSIGAGARNSSPRRSVSELPTPPDTGRKGSNSSGHFVHNGVGLSRSDSLPNGAPPLSPRKPTQTGEPGSPVTLYQQQVEALPESLMRRYAYIPPDLLVNPEVPDRHAQSEVSPRREKPSKKVTSADVAVARLFMLQQRSAVFKVQQLQEEMTARASAAPCTSGR